MRHQHVMVLVCIDSTVVLFAMTSCAVLPAAAAVVSADRCPTHPGTQFLDPEKFESRVLNLPGCHQGASADGTALGDRRLTSQRVDSGRSTDHRRIVTIRPRPGKPRAAEFGEVAICLSASDRFLRAPNYGSGSTSAGRAGERSAHPTSEKGDERWSNVTGAAVPRIHCPFASCTGSAPPPSSA
jgi:hypothetical protein